RNVLDDLREDHLVERAVGEGQGVDAPAQRDAAAARHEPQLLDRDVEPHHPGHALEDAARSAADVEDLSAGAVPVHDDLVALALPVPLEEVLAVVGAVVVVAPVAAVAELPERVSVLASWMPNLITRALETP